jgi:hypothetical protein
MTDGAPAAAQGRRLTLAAGLAWRARRCADGAAPDDLLGLAGRLAAAGPPVERAHRVRFEPPYPGATAGPETVAGGRRLVLACRALGPGGAEEAVVFTTLIAGRPPQVSAAPPATPIPPRWTLRPVG